MSQAWIGRIVCQAPANTNSNTVTVHHKTQMHMFILINNSEENYCKSGSLVDVMGSTILNFLKHAKRCSGELQR